jgi:hypothetical protein
MKKVLASSAIILSGAFVLFLNVSTNGLDKTAKDNSFSLSNILTLQASAGEWYCDASSNTTCCFPGQSPESCALSTGQLVYIP